MSLAPNQVRAFDVAIVIGGVVEGSVVVDGGSLPPDGGVNLVLTELGSGRRRVLDVFTDGSFYQMGVRPGRYELTVERSALASLRMVADTVRFELPPGPVGGGAAPSAEARLKAALKTPGPTISGLEVHLRRAGPAQSR